MAKKVSTEAKEKYVTPFEDTEDLFNKVISTAGLDGNAIITVVVHNRAKELFKVNKANDLMKFRSGDDVIIVLNETIFCQLSDDDKEIVTEEAVAFIGYNFEKSRVEIQPKNFSSHIGILRKYSYDKIQTLHEQIELLYQSQKESEEEDEAAVN